MTPAPTSVVIPVRDGERYLEELLAALRAQDASLEVLVIDSGSRDRSVQIARAGGAEVLQIEPGEFGHGRTRNLGVQRTSGELICFLTQDATPVPGWLEAYHESFALAERVGAAYGPHIPRPGASPMIARELNEFFATFSPNGAPVVQRGGDPTFLSNVNACYARECVEEIGFRDVAYSEDQAFGADLLDAGWLKVFHPGAAVWHSHDYSIPEFLGRYFDEYRGLRRTVGHVERLALAPTVRDVGGLVRGDLHWMRAHGYGLGAQARWSARSAVHHGGRKLFSALGSRADSLPPALQRRLSLEARTADAQPPQPGASAASNGARAEALPVPATEPPQPLPALKRIDWIKPRDDYWAVEQFFRDGAAALLDPIAGMADKPRLHLAFVVPPFGIGSGGHATIFRLLRFMEQRGHTCSIWVHDPFGERAGEWPAVMRRVVVDHFSPVAAPLHKEFDDWRGADVVVATGWQTVYPALLLPGVRARVYLINDHEPEFYATSVESFWADQTYRLGLYGICAGPWLRDLYVERYGGSAGYFELGVDHDVYTPRPIERRPDTVVFYCRQATARRAFSLASLALRELHARRPQLRVVTFGQRHAPRLGFEYDHAGVVSPHELSWLYSQATVGLCLSMTNYSLIPQEMLACGLPCVELAHPSTEAVFGADGPVSLTAFRPGAIADAIDELMHDEQLWQRRSQAGLEFVAGRSWERAADVFERELREALRRREHGERSASTPQLSLDRPTDAPAVRKALQWGHARIPEALQSHAVTDRLYGRLREQDIEAVREAADAQQREQLDAASPEHRRVLTLAFGVHHRVAGVLERTGLVAASPPADVHSMARGADAAGGGYWYADLIAEEVRLAGADIASFQAALDFGCSSGRVVRVLAAAYPDVGWQGCDPNLAAIEWASRRLPGIRFFVSPQEPPLELADCSLDLVFAISVWSHYGARAAVDWLAELHRIIKPGGLALLSTHGLISLDYYRRTGQRGKEQLDEIERALTLQGFWFKDEFGTRGDWGVKHPQWGTAFLSPTWLLERLGGAWELSRFAPGKIEGNQDVYVLRRV